MLDDVTAHCPTPVSSLYNNEDFFADLSHIIVLRQSSASLMRECNDQFLDEYLHLTDQVLDAVNPYFNLAWQVPPIAVQQL